MESDQQNRPGGSMEDIIKPISTRPDRTLKVRDLTPHLTCGLCSGYLINAVTVIECLHSFCRSCIVLYLLKNRDCPTCRIVIHEAYPLHHVRMDRTMSDIVYKLVPGLQEAELEREQTYNEAHGIVPVAPEEDEAIFPMTGTNGVRSLGASTTASSVASDGLQRGGQAMASTGPDNEELISVHLKRRETKDSASKRSPVKKLQLPYLCMSSKVTVNILRKYIKTKLSLSESTNVEVLYDEQVLGKEHSLEFLSRTRWRLKKTDIVSLSFSIDAS